jgi:hypothetical protein
MPGNGRRAAIGTACWAEAWKGAVEANGCCSGLQTAPRGGSCREAMVIAATESRPLS